MATSGNTSIARLGVWGRAHPRTSAVMIGLLSFLLGTTAGGSGTAGLEADLAAARDDARSIQAEADGDVDDLSGDVEALEERVAKLTAENAALTRQVERVNARRELPNVVGAMEGRALELEDDYGWAVSVEYRYATARPGTILSQRPAAGTMMRYGAPYTVVVAKALPQLEGVVGMWRRAAERALSRWNVVVVEQVSAKAPGRVIGMTPAAGARLMPGATVTLTVAKKAPPPPPEPEVEAPSAGGCTPGYSPCLPPASDYDCSGGTGDGPEYTTYVTVTGSDPYGLDSDGDGTGCES